MPSRRILGAAVVVIAMASALAGGRMVDFGALTDLVEQHGPIAAAIAAAVVVAVAAGRRIARRARIRDWHDAELATAVWLRRAGCRGVALTGGSADGGIDVVTDEWAVQVKHRAKRVGRPAVQQLVGAALSLERRPALFSTSGYSAPALAYADEHDVALFVLGLDGRAVTVNGTARRVGRRRLRR